MSASMNRACEHRRSAILQSEMLVDDSGSQSQHRSPRRLNSSAFTTSGIAGQCKFALLVPEFNVRISCECSHLVSIAGEVGGLVGIESLDNCKMRPEHVGATCGDSHQSNDGTRTARPMNLAITNSRSFFTTGTNAVPMAVVFAASRCPPSTSFVAGNRARVEEMHALLFGHAA